MSAAIKLIDVRVGSEESERQVEVSLAVDEGEWLVLLGPTRSGKSVILELCAGLIVPDEGTVRLLGRDLRAATEDDWLDLRARVGTVLQQPGLLSNMTVFNNVALPLRYHNADMDEKTVRARVAVQLDALGLAALADRFPSQLTQGEVRCAAIGRALILGQEVLLLDDPAAGLDADMARNLVAYLSDLRRGRPLTILSTMRTFSPFLDAADRVAFLSGGRVEASGPPAQLVAAMEPSWQGYLQPRRWS